MRYKTDVLVIGSGIAGLSFALKAAENANVTVISKTKIGETNTRYAQGGIAAVMYQPDNYQKHIEDTLIAGAGLCNKNIVEITVKESTERIKELILWGANFDKTNGGKYDLGKEGGHSEFRVLHHKDDTGKEIQRTLIEKASKHPRIKILENHFVIDIITQHHLGIEVTRRTPDIKCYGAYILDLETNEVNTFLAKATLMASGGVGNTYNTTTNPPIATGDGIACVYRAKGMIENMEFIQFHPTSLYNPSEKPSYLITEALRGFGALLKTGDNEEFMHKYDKRGSLAPRDIVARAIDNQMKISGDDFVYLDCRHLNQNELINHFPNIYAKCFSLGINLKKDMIPVVPAAHYSCGGIKTDEFGRTSILNLYATGECASTGLHGANRLASNSLLEALVFSHRASIDLQNSIKNIDFCENIPDWDAEGMVLNEELVLVTQSLKEVQSIMSNYVGIVRSDLRLKRAFDRLEIIYQETEDLYNKSILTQKICELRNIINVAYLIIKGAMNRKESIGLHYSINYQ